MTDTRATRALSEERTKDTAWAAALEDARKKGMSGDLIPRYFFFEAGWNAAQAESRSDCKDPGLLWREREQARGERDEWENRYEDLLGSVGGTSPGP